MIQADLSTIVTYNPWAVSDCTTLSELVGLLDSVDFHHWPIVDDDRRLLGMLSNSDLVRVFEAGSAALHAPQDHQHARLAFIRSQPVREVMTTRIISVQQNESPATALWMLLEHHIHSLPVLTDSYLTALVTTSDFLREFSYSGELAATLPVTEIMQAPCEPIDCDASLDEVAMAMHFAQATAVPVVRGDMPLGVVSHREVGMLKLQKTLSEVFGVDVRRQEATSILALVASAPTIRPGERISHAASMMIEHRRQAIAVVNQAGRLLGIVTEEMVLRSMLDSMRS